MSMTKLHFFFVIHCLLLLFHLQSRAQVFPDEPGVRVNEWDRLFPTVVICVLARNKAHTLPYFLGYLEELDYPKDRISLFIRTDHNSDDTRKILDAWTEAVSEFYHKIDYSYSNTPNEYADESGPFHWSDERKSHVTHLKEEALKFARDRWADYIFYVDCDVFLTNSRVLQALITAKKPVIVPFLMGPRNDEFLFTNFDVDDDENSTMFNFLTKREQPDVYVVREGRSCILIDLLTIKSSQLTFDPALLPRVDQLTVPTDSRILSQSIKSSGLQYHLNNRRLYGFVLPPMNADLVSLEFDVENMRYLSLEALHDGPPGLLHSPFVPPTWPAATKLGFDEIFLINLKRRPDRLRRMKECFKILGVDYTVIEATDGQNLTDQDIQRLGVKPLAEFRDPYRNRIVTKGEIGCFYSHYRIWRTVVEKRYSRVVVFEDDLRFVRYSTVMLKNLLLDLDSAAAVKFSWDLIYLGRKRLKSEHELLPAVADVRNLAQVGYSYWTLGYVLSLSGAEKLLRADPLQKLIPVDEYLPVMFDKHPDQKLKQHFAERNLLAYTMEPLIVHPVRYTGQTGYVSDTENTDLIDESLLDSGDPNLGTSRLSDEL